jgi:hypothetical protein
MTTAFHLSYKCQCVLPTFCLNQNQVRLTQCSWWILSVCRFPFSTFFSVQCIFERNIPEYFDLCAHVIFWVEKGRKKGRQASVTLWWPWWVWLLTTLFRVRPAEGKPCVALCFCCTPSCLSLSVTIRRMGWEVHYSWLLRASEDETDSEAWAGLARCLKKSTEVALRSCRVSRMGLSPLGGLSFGFLVLDFTWITVSFLTEQKDVI